MNPSKLVLHVLIIIIYFAL